MKTRLARLSASLGAQRYGVALAALALLFAFGVPAYAVDGASTAANSLAKALRIAKKADKRSKQALSLARKVSAKGGQQGPAGPQGQPGSQGPAGAQGDQGPSGPFPDALPSGKTLRGAYTVGGMSEDVTTGDVLSGVISFPFPLASAPTGQVVSAGGTAPPNCPGTDDDPQAAPGMLCVYVGSNTQANNPTLQDPTTSANAPSRFGVTLIVTSSTATAGVAIRSQGTWAVTAP